MQMKLEAKVRRVTGKTVHRFGTIANGRVVPLQQMPVPASVQIAQLQSPERGYYLLYFDSAGGYLTDTWHATLEDAKEQAKFEFEIEESDWVELDADSRGA
jgi:hypothetical protein